MNGAEDGHADYLLWHMCYLFCVSSALTRSSRYRFTTSSGSQTRVLSSPYPLERPISSAVCFYYLFLYVGSRNAHKQTTGVKPFYLHLLPLHLAHRCPIRALAQWLHVSQITEGYLFRKIASGDRVSNQNSHMVSFISRLCLRT
jgi:hypothetical protein